MSGQSGSHSWRDPDNPGRGSGLRVEGGTVLNINPYDYDLGPETGSSSGDDEEVPAWTVDQTIRLGEAVKNVDYETAEDAIVNGADLRKEGLVQDAM